MNQLLNSQNEVIDSQKRLRKEQSELQAAIADSITRAGVEKQLIKSRQKDVEKLGRTINVHICKEHCVSTLIHFVCFSMVRDLSLT